MTTTPKEGAAFDVNALIDSLATSKATLTAAQGDITTLKAANDKLTADLAAAQTALGDAKELPAKLTAMTATITGVTTYMADQAKKYAVALNSDVEAVAKLDLPALMTFITDSQAKLSTLVPEGGRSKTVTGKALKRLATRPAAIVTFLDGMWPRRITVEHCAQLGEALARMHVAGADFPMRRVNSLSVAGWRPLFNASLDHADEVRAGLADEIGRELDALEAAWPADLPSGVIHADLFPDNVFFRREKLSGLIDFYFACTDAFAYDLAICMNAWCFEVGNSFNVTKARRMLTAYSKVRKFSDKELDALPLLARGSAMRFLLTRLYDWVHTPKDALVTPKDPLEYLAKLRFHQGVKGPGAYGLK